MFELAEAKQADPIIQQAKAFKVDPRQEKINLGIGVYRDDTGATPVMRAVKQAEDYLVKTQSSKEYVGVTGDEAYLNAVAKFAFPKRTYGEDVLGIQSVGGSGALRILFESAARVGRSHTIWTPEPTWPNHLAIARACGLKIKTYSYLQDNKIDFQATLNSLEVAQPGDLVVIHLCCHNPTGVDLTLKQMGALARFVAQHQLVPVLDAAYVGFGDTLQQDLTKCEAYINHVPELLLAMSFSKNFGIYRERAGAAFLFSKNKDALVKMAQNTAAIVRPDYSMPPDHGAQIVHTILANDKMYKIWLDELEAMRNRMIKNRIGLAQAMAERLPDQDFDYVAHGKGMFCRIEIGADNVAKMIEQTGIYIIPDGRINLAGVTQSNVQRVADALAAGFRASK